MSSRSYPEQSWFDPRLEKRSSPIHGTGIFATQFIRAGERIAIPGGIVVTSQDKAAGNVKLDPTKAYNEAQLDDNVFLLMPIDEDLYYFFNHSCDPNFWGETTRRDIAPGEEITTDYALEIADDDYCLAPCRCGSPLCRQHVTGNDWQRPELQARYDGKFAFFIQRRIEDLRQDD
ncbi:MAG: SET domain-containing protein-lysine N-methyltransferase [Chloroflexi bacterium]|nr:SET domain-containing protein-lysine N-methyltransferase [Chloroflexota bacterium]